MFCNKFHAVTKRSQIHPNTMKCTETLVLGPNGLDWVRSLQKITTLLPDTNFCINCTSSPCFASSFKQLRNNPKCSQTLYDTPKHKFRVQWGGLGAFVVKNPDATSWHEFCFNCTSSPVLHRVSCSDETIPNASKHYATH